MYTKLTYTQHTHANSIYTTHSTRTYHTPILSCLLLTDGRGEQQLEGLEARLLRKADFLARPPWSLSQGWREVQQERDGRRPKGELGRNSFKLPRESTGEGKSHTKCGLTAVRLKCQSSQPGPGATCPDFFTPCSKVSCCPSHVWSKCEENTKISLLRKHQVMNRSQANIPAGSVPAKLTGQPEHLKDSS